MSETEKTKKSVLVVEDNDFVRMQIVTYLRAAGYETQEASGGEKAGEMMIPGSGIELAIVDVRMEPVGGFEFIRDLRARDIDTPVVLVTGDQTPDILERAGKLGVGAVLMKPVDKDRLLKTVERTLAQKRRGR